MTVAELIEALSAMPQEMPVCLMGECVCDIEADFVRVDWPNPNVLIGYEDSGW